jgi:chromosomal replication initiation ATPase DnaA
MEILMSKVCETFGITAEEIRGPSMKRKYVGARQSFIAQAYAQKLGTMTDIGEALNKKGHCVVSHHLRKLGLKAGAKGAVQPGLFAEEIGRGF